MLLLLKKTPSLLLSNQDLFKDMERVERVLLVLVAILFCSFLILPTSPHRITLYIIFINGFLYLKARKNIPISQLVKNKIFACVIVFLSFNLISLLWSDIGDYETVWQKIKPAIFLIIFIYIWISFFKNKSQLISLLNELYIITAAITAIILLIINAPDIYMHYFVEQKTWRLNGFGRAENSNLAGLFYGIAMLCLFFLKAKTINILQNKYFKTLCLCVIASVFFLTLSRGAFLALICTFCLVSLYSTILANKSWNVFYITIGVIFAASLLLSVFFPHVVIYMIERGSTGRIELWQMAYEQFLQAPLFGHGIGTRFSYDLTLNNGHAAIVGHTHNMYLSALVHLGLVGLVLFLLLCIHILIGVFQYTKQTKDYNLLIIVMFGMVFGLVDTGGHYYALSNSWFVFWIPIAQLVTYQISKEEK